MNKSLLLFSAAASLAVGACTQDKQAAVDAATTPSADTAVVVNDDMSYRADADRVITRVANDLDLNDTTVVSTIGRTYYDRGRRISELNRRYATDTVGRYAALRAVNDETDNAVKTALNDDERYNTYTSNRDTYYEGTPYTATVKVAEPVVVAAPVRRRGPRVVEYDKKRDGDVKITYSNGKVVKIDKDGDTKVEYPNGTKVKRDADDGEVKVKR